jgi:hypothetical protein
LRREPDCTVPPHDSIADSFFVVPPSSAPPPNPAPSASRKADRPSLAPRASTSSKTIEELTLENESLKANLDAFARQYQQLVDDRVVEKEALKGSIVAFGKEVRREAERAALASTQVLTKPPSVNGGAFAPSLSSTVDC